MSPNPSIPGGKPSSPNPAAGQPAKIDLNALAQAQAKAKAKAESGKATLNSQEEYMKNLLEKMIQENPAGVAEIIHLWLNQDKSRNE